MWNKQAMPWAALLSLAVTSSAAAVLVPSLDPALDNSFPSTYLPRPEEPMAITGVTSEGWRVAEEIAQAKMPVQLNPIENEPAWFEMLGATLSNARLLHAAGVVIGFEANGPQRERELRLNAGSAVAHGLPHDAALAAITINPARIFGLADTAGMLEPGKAADVVNWDGDPLETTTRPVAIDIDGMAQPMTSRQTELRDRYLSRENTR